MNLSNPSQLPTISKSCPEIGDFVRNNISGNYGRVTSVQLWCGLVGVRVGRVRRKKFNYWQLQNIVVLDWHDIPEKIFPLISPWGQEKSRYMMAYQPYHFVRNRISGKIGRIIRDLDHKVRVKRGLGDCITWAKSSVESISIYEIPDESFLKISPRAISKQAYIEKYYDSAT